MNVQFEQSLNLSDTLVPDLFITDYMTRLSGLAIQCYLLLLLTGQHGTRHASAAELTQRLGQSEQRVEQALSELQRHHLIIVQANRIDLCDLKSREIMTHFTPRQQPRELLSDADLNKREAVIRQINDTFFQGVMSLSFYLKIDEWFSKYQFEPEVVYAIFNEASARNRLDGPGYVCGIADNWGAHGVKTYRQLNQYYKNYERSQSVSYQIRKKLNMRHDLTSYQEKLVQKWVQTYEFDFEIIDLALAKTVKLTNPNLEYVDRILSDWHERRLKDVGSILAAEQSYREKNATQTADGARVKRAHKVKRAETDQDIPEQNLYQTELIRQLSKLDQEDAQTQ